MEIMRNPAMLQEVMRNQDRALSNIEVSAVFNIHCFKDIKSFF